MKVLVCWEQESWLLLPSESMNLLRHLCSFLYVCWMEDQLLLLMCSMEIIANTHFWPPDSKPSSTFGFLETPISLDQILNFSYNYSQARGNKENMFLFLSLLWTESRGKQEESGGNRKE
ncbi:hypothetical protein V6N11_050156 [Hibiscus sabdariffa]|uniref:Uncharacterized protein n=2 Tax=Hibiscus sabdariffa TaxID=183260 RepID=A0ABR2AKY4_9ROSI